MKSTGHAVVNDLAETFGVSTVTIRKDLDGLEQRNLLRRVRGGAVSVDGGDEGSFDLRMRQSSAAKRAIAKSAAAIVRHGDVLAIDASTTGYYLAQEILDRRNLVVVTNAIRVATLFMEQSSAKVLVPGGLLRRSSGSLVGPIGDVLAGRGRISTGFFGVVGVSTMHGLMEMSAEEAQTKRFLADACDRVIGLFDSSKVGGFGLHSFAAVPAITAMYTDSSAPPSLLAEWEKLGVPVHFAAPDAADQVHREHSTHRRFTNHRTAVNP
jgi:DeoR/GlpR family transcriptional regulator of sugar metabolism